MTEEYPIIVTDIRMKKLEAAGRAVAIASITLNGGFVIHGIRVILAENDKRFVAMPSKRNPKTGFIDIAHPINPKVREDIEIAILKAYSEI